MGEIWNLLVLNPMINSLLALYGLFIGSTFLQTIGAFGLAIVVFTIVIRLLTLPLTIKQQQSSQSMQEMQKDPRLEKIKKKYKDNPQKQQEEQMKLYRELGINPVAGCLPTLVQLPILFGLYGAIIRVLANTPLQLLDLSRHIYDRIPSIIIPLDKTFLWMDLSRPERLDLGLIPDTVPILGAGIPVLAILAVVTTYFQTKLTTPPDLGGSGAGMTQAMSLYMPLLLGWLAYSFPAGLAVYFVTSNLLGILQGWAMRRFRPPKAVGASPKPAKKGA